MFRVKGSAGWTGWPYEVKAACSSPVRRLTPAAIFFLTRTLTLRGQGCVFKPRKEIDPGSHLLFDPDLDLTRSRLRVQAPKEIDPSSHLLFDPDLLTRSHHPHHNSGTWNKAPDNSLSSSTGSLLSELSNRTSSLQMCSHHCGQPSTTWKKRGHPHPQGGYVGGSACSWTLWTAQSSTTNLTNPRIHFIPHWAPFFYNPRGFQICYFLKHLFQHRRSVGPIC